MGSSNEARPLGRAAFYFCFDVFLFFFHADRASCINIYLYHIYLFFLKILPTKSYEKLETFPCYLSVHMNREVFCFFSWVLHGKMGVWGLPQKHF